MSDHSFHRMRPNSYPDPWRSEAEAVPTGDRPRSVLDVQGVEGRPPNASENNEMNKAKVNPWVESEAESGDSGAANRKQFYHCPQRPSPLTSEAISTRPQTEPGRCKDKMFVENIKTLARQSVHDVASNSPASSSKSEQETGEDWVVVDKFPSNTVMPCDSEDESNVLVPSPNATSAPMGKQDIRDSQGRAPSGVSSTFGSLIESLSGTPVAQERVDANEDKKQDNTPAAPSTRKTVTSFGNIGTFATTLMKWKRRRGTAEARMRLGYASLHQEQQKILADESSAIKTEIPEAMMRTIKEEAYKVVFKTTQAYRSQIGGRHKLTRQAYEYLKDLKEELQK